MSLEKTKEHIILSITLYIFIVTATLSILPQKEDYTDFAHLIAVYYGMSITALVFCYVLLHIFQQKDANCFKKYPFIGKCLFFSNVYLFVNLIFVSILLLLICTYPQLLMKYFIIFNVLVPWGILVVYVIVGIYFLFQLINNDYFRNPKHERHREENLNEENLYFLILGSLIGIVLTSIISLLF